MSTPEQPAQQHPPAGWYPDPESPGQSRYWDGSAWSEPSERVSLDKDAGQQGAGQQAGAGPQQAGAQQAGWGQQQGYYPGGPPTYAGQPGWGPQATSSDSRTWALLAHLSPLLLGLIGPLIAYLVKKDEDPFVRDQAAEALNFNISWTIYMVAWMLVSFVLMFVLIGFILIFLLIPAAIAWLVLIIMAAVKTNQGITYRYPLTIRMVS